MNGEVRGGEAGQGSMPVPGPPYGNLTHEERERSPLRGWVFPRPRGNDMGLDSWCGTPFEDSGRAAPRTVDSVQRHRVMKHQGEALTGDAAW